MRRKLAVAACVVAILGMLAPTAALAQAPAPKVTISGLFDQITSFGRNIYDGDFSRSNETEWYARTRFRPDFEFAVGRTKAVLGLEIDATYGVTSATGADGGSTAAGTGAACGKAGSNGCFDQNTDINGIIEIKWMYTEFDLTGKDSLLPFIPVPTVARVGAQPLGGLAHYKLAAFANGDFAGLSTRTTFAPNLKLNLVYNQLEEETAAQERASGTGAGAAQISRGDDFGIIMALEVTPFKGLDIMPMYSYMFLQGTTAGQTRRTVSDNRLAGGTSAAAGTYATAAKGNPNSDLHENRHTIGVDARFRSGPFSFDPTIYFQWGSREQINIVTGAPGSVQVLEADMRSWLIDVIGGYRMGPLLLEARYHYTTGNEARDHLGSRVRYFEPMSTDTGWWAGWADIYGLGLDYFNGGGGTLNAMSTNFGYDRYGRHGFGVRATYSLTPALNISGAVLPTWTAESVDTDTAAGRAMSATQANSNNPCGAAGNACVVTDPRPQGDSRYLGTEINSTMNWRFAPNVTFSVNGSYLFAGSALDTTVPAVAGSNGNTVVREASDGWQIGARLRFAF